MSDELKLSPCPFCGNSPPSIHRLTPERPYVYCARCAAEGPPAPDESAATAAWNTRADHGARGHMAAIGALADSLPVDEDAEREVRALVEAHRQTRASHPIDHGAQAAPCTCECCTRVRDLAEEWAARREREAVVRHLLATADANWPSDDDDGDTDRDEELGEAVAMALEAAATRIKRGEHVKEGG